MIPANDLIRLFRQMYDERWPYVWGKAEKGCVDCSGAYVYAYRQFGKSIPHGSNAIARGYVRGLLPVSEAVPGMAAFKKRQPGQRYYDLPAKYQKGGAAYNGDLNDYYHIGLVDETGKYVLNAQGEKAGFTRTPISKWGAVGYLKAVDYGKTPEKEEKPMTTMYVTAPNGEPVRVRKQPSTTAETVGKLRVGLAVDAGEDNNGWRKVHSGTVDGYMMSKFLSASQDAQNGQQTASGAAGGESTAFVRTLSTEEFDHLCDVRDNMEKDLAFLKTIVGVG